MRLIPIFFFILCLVSAPLANLALAQDVNASFYEVADVAVDVTAKNAAQARDQAIIQAQRLGLNGLLERLGVNPDAAKNLSSDDIATLVQSFEVQNERASSVRYIGTFTVQYKPNAVRSYLGSLHVAFSETRSRPFLVLPIYAGGPKPILWEEPTKWRTAWEGSAANNGVVPTIIPAGDLGDLSLLTTDDAVAGKADNLKALSDKYQAAGIIIALLKNNIDAPGAALQVELHHYATDGTAGDVAPLNLPAPVAQTSIDALLADAVKKARAQIDKDWRAHGSADEGPTPPSPDENANTGAAVTEANNVPTPTATPAGPTAHLSLQLAINNLAEWSAIKNRLNNAPNVVRANVISLQRGATVVDLEFRGTIPDLQMALARQGLSLTLNNATGAWTLVKNPASF